MYKYTPAPALRAAWYRAIYNVGGVGRWAFTDNLCLDYQMRIAFIEHWEGTCYFSPTPLQKVPVNGVLFPVLYFKEDLVDACLD